MSAWPLASVTDPAQGSAVTVMVSARPAASVGWAMDSAPACPVMTVTALLASTVGGGVTDKEIVSFALPPFPSETE